MFLGPEKSKLVNELLDENHQEVIEKLNGINNKTKDRFEEIVIMRNVFFVLLLFYGFLALMFKDLKLIEIEDLIETILYKAYMTTVTFGLMSFGALLVSAPFIGFSTLRQNASNVYRNYKFTFKSSYKALLLDDKINSTDVALKSILPEEYYNMMESFRIFVRNEDHEREDRNVNFIEHLFLEKQFDKLLTVVKLFPNKFEEFEASNFNGRYSLLWQATKYINKHKISVPGDTPVNVELAMEASKKYAI
jgi:hypothetical protein